MMMTGELEIRAGEIAKELEAAAAREEASFVTVDLNGGGGAKPAKPLEGEILTGPYKGERLRRGRIIPDDWEKPRPAVAPEAPQARETEPEVEAAPKASAPAGEAAELEIELDAEEEEEEELAEPSPQAMSVELAAKRGELVPIDRNELMEAIPKKLRAALVALNHRHAVIGNVGGKCRVVEWVPSDLDPGALVPMFQSKTDFINRYAHRKVGFSRKGEPLSLGQW